MTTTKQHTYPITIQIIVPVWATHRATLHYTTEQLLQLLKEHPTPTDQQLHDHYKAIHGIADHQIYTESNTYYGDDTGCEQFSQAELQDADGTYAWEYSLEDIEDLDEETYLLLTQYQGA
jgi:hypothetical protein